MTTSPVRGQRKTVHLKQPHEHKRAGPFFRPYLTSFTVDEETNERSVMWT